MTTIEELRKDRWLFYMEGILLMALGILAIVLPQVTTVSLAVLAGIFLIIAGAIMFFRAFRHGAGRIFWLSLLSGIIAIATGGFMLNNLAAGMYVLTMFLVIFLILEGSLKIILANSVKSHRNWGYLLFSGITTLLLALFIIIGMPTTIFWALGLLFGIYLLVAGFSMIAFGIGLEKSYEERAH